jgi:hypothetical protein
MTFIIFLQLVQLFPVQDALGASRGLAALAAGR